MSHLAAKRGLSFKRLAVVLLVVVGMIGIALLLQTSAQEVNAQTASTTMSQLLKQLSAEQRQITFGFVVPLVADENIWVVPNENNDISINIDKIGEDHICFLRRGGQAYDEICTPFTNIAAVSYLNMPE